MDLYTWQRLTRGIRQKFAELIRRGVLSHLDSSTGLQTVQAKAIAGETLGEMEYFEPYGFSSAPFTGAEPLAITVEGKRGHEVVISIADRRYRLTSLAEGEVAMFDDLGNKVHLMRDQILVEAVQHLEVTAPTAEITATTTHIGDLTINGTLTVNGPIIGTATIEAAGAISSATSIADPTGTMEEMRTVYNGHDHDDPQGGKVLAPNQKM